MPNWKGGAGMAAVLLAAALPGGAFTAGESRADAAAERAALQGSWIQEGAETGGRPIEGLGYARLFVDGEKFALRSGGVTHVAGSFRLDPSRTPKAIDLSYTAGPDAGKTLAGIYSREGEALKLHRAGEPGGERPSDFVTRPGGRTLLTLYRRERL